MEGCTGGLWDIIAGSADEYLEKELVADPPEGQRLATRRRRKKGVASGDEAPPVVVSLPPISHGLKLVAPGPKLTLGSGTKPQPPTRKQESPRDHPPPKVARRKSVGDTDKPKESFNPNVQVYKGEIVNMAMQQNSCRYLQKQVNNKETHVINFIFSEVLPAFTSLINHPFGNYLCQHLIDKCSTKQRREIIDMISEQLVDISCSMYGSRPMQKLIERLGARVEDIDVIVSRLKGSVVQLTQDLNGNHVIQKCIRCLGSAESQFVYDSFAQHCNEIATHRFGCCVMQTAIDHGSKQQQEQLVQAVEQNCALLVRDPFGNYIVQHVLDLGREDITDRIVARLEGQFMSLSLLKFSSNVVDKCIKLGTPENFSMILREILEISSDGSERVRITHRLQEKFLELASDSYGNYVLQALLNEGPIKGPTEYNMLIEVLESQLSELRHTPCYTRLLLILNRSPSISPLSPRSTRGAPTPSANQTTPPKLKLGEEESRGRGTRGGGGDGGAFSGSGGGGASSGSGGTHSARTRRNLSWVDVADSAVVVDVRETFEFEAGHYEGALSIPMGEFIKEASSPSPSAKFSQLKATKMVVVYCQDGTRSKIVLDFSQRFGISNMWIIDGGFNARLAQG